MNYQYFIQVVPTDVQMASGFNYPTYQYSVKNQERPIDHMSDSHGTPGIYFKYDMSALKVRVSQDREPLPQFLIRLCAGVGGLVATSQLVCGLIQAAIKYYCCGVDVAAGAGSRSGSASSARAPPGAGSGEIKTAGLIPPQERIKKPSTAGANVVTLQEVEKLMHD